MVLPEYCAMIAQYSLFANGDRTLAKRREVLQITRWVIYKTNVVNPVWHCIYSAITALCVDFVRLACKIHVINK